MRSCNWKDGPTDGWNYFFSKLDGDIIIGNHIQYHYDMIDESQSTFDTNLKPGNYIRINSRTWSKYRVEVGVVEKVDQNPLRKKIKKGTFYNDDGTTLTFQT